MSDDKFDTWLSTAAMSYNVPPADIPREDMWEAITRQLDTESAAVRSRHRWPAPVYTVAATVLLAIGIGTGYWIRDRSPAGVQPSAAPVTAAAPAGISSNDVALQRYMSDAEALLVAYRTSSDSADRRVRTWARDVLSTTRLMLDSPIGRDPARRRLLEDLELVLVQIVQQRGDVPESERQLIDESLRRDHLLTRLRTSVPAGIVRGT